MHVMQHQSGRPKLELVPCIAQIKHSQIPIYEFEFNYHE